MSDLSDMRLLIVGFGYSAATVARVAMNSGASVVGTVTGQQEAARLEAAGLETLVFDGVFGTDAVRTALVDATHILVTVPAQDNGDPVLPSIGQDIFSRPKPLWVGYMSTVGVYGDHRGAEVTEETRPRPSRKRARNRLAAERAWTAAADAADVPLSILRLGGIYGPGRNALFDLARGKAHRIVKPGHVSSRIHVEDLAIVTLAAAVRRADGIFNVVDDEPAPPQDVVAYAAQLMGIEPPPEVPLEEAKLSPMGRSFYADERRVLNAKVRDRLGTMYRFPTYRLGLGQMWRDGTWKG